MLVWRCYSPDASLWQSFDLTLCTCSARCHFRTKTSKSGHTPQADSPTPDRSCNKPYPIFPTPSRLNLVRKANFGVRHTPLTPPISTPCPHPSYSAHQSDHSGPLHQYQDLSVLFLPQSPKRCVSLAPSLLRNDITLAHYPKTKSRNASLKS